LMDDPCNAVSSQNFASDLLAQQKLLKNPCTEPIDPQRWYPYKLAIQSDWDEIDTVIDYIRKLRGVDKVSLIGWSRGGPRVGSYAAQSQYAGKVEKLVLYSPAMYDHDGPSEPFRDYLDGKGHLKRPERGTLMQLGTVAGFEAN